MRYLLPDSAQFIKYKALCNRPASFENVLGSSNRQPRGRFRANCYENVTKMLRRYQHSARIQFQKPPLKFPPHKFPIYPIQPRNQNLTKLENFGKIFSKTS